MDRTQNKLLLDEINEKWTAFSFANDEESLEEYTNHFLELYGCLIDLEYRHLDEGLPSKTSPGLAQLPDSFLHRLSHFVTKLAADFSKDVNIHKVRLMTAIFKCLIVICRNDENIAFVASCEFVRDAVSTSQIVLSKGIYLNGNAVVAGKDDSAMISHFLEIVLHLLQCMYDPHFQWRKKVNRYSVKAIQYCPQAAFLHNEVIPFFYDCLQIQLLDENILLNLLHTFGAIISGNENNSSLAITPATLDVLLCILSNKSPCLNGVTEEVKVKVQMTVLSCIVRMLHCVHSSSPDQRQIEVAEVIQGYLRAMVQVEKEEKKLHIIIPMIDKIGQMVDCHDRTAVQVLIGSDQTFYSVVSFIENCQFQGSEAQKLATAVTKSLHCLLKGSLICKKTFLKHVGYSKLLQLLRNLGQPSSELLQELLNLVVESDFKSLKVPVIRNPAAAVTLLRWLDHIENPELQIWLSRVYKQMCSCCYSNRMSCCGEGMLAVTLSLLSQHGKFHKKAVGHLIQLLERLGSLSITSTELRTLIGLMKQSHEGHQFPFSTRLMRAISTMARRDGSYGPLDFFDIQEMSDCISLPGIRKWPGVAFSFFAWICLDADLTSDRYQHMGPGMQYRRLLYSICNTNSNGFEAFVTPEFKLMVASVTKKEYNTATVTDFSFDDGQWHSLAISYVGGRRFSQSPGQVVVYIDGKKRMSAPMKFPSLSEPFNSCHVGSPGVKTVHEVVSDAVCPHSNTEMKKPSTLKSIFGFVNRSSFSATPVQDVLTIMTGMQDEILGPAICLYGQLESICLFHDALQADHAKALNSIGPNSLFHFTDNPTISDLPSRLLVRYSAKACQGNVCADLSPNQNNGIFSGVRCVNWDIKDVINCLGGIQVLFPLLEQLDQSLSRPADPFDSPPSPSPDELDDQDLDDWEFGEDRKASELKMEHNQLAAFITMIRYMLKGKVVNQDIFVQTKCATTLGMLIQKIPRTLVDVNVLMSVQYLVEDCDNHLEVRSTIIQHIYHYLLFDFSLWNDTDFAVRIGHIQYLSTIIKDDRKYFRKKYGVQFILDVIRAYYSTCESSGLGEEDSKTIRVSLLNLIKYYIVKDVTSDELNQLLGFILSTQQSNLLLEALDMLMSLLSSGSRKQDQLILLLYEPEQAEMFYQLLTYPNQPIILYEKVVKLLYLLLKSERVYEKSKARLRLAEVGHSGLANLMTSYDISAPMIKRFIEQVSFIETPQTYSAVLAILSLGHKCGLDIKSEASRQLLALLVSKSSAPKGFSKCLGWQEVITRLLTLERKVFTPAKTDNSERNRRSTSSSLLIEPVDTSLTQPSLESQTVTSTPSAMSNTHDAFEALQSPLSPVASESGTGPLTSPVRPNALGVPTFSEFNSTPIKSKEDASCLLLNLTPATPMYLKRQFHDLNSPDRDENADNFHAGSRSSSASVEDLLGENVDSSSGNMSNSASNLSISFSSALTESSSGIFEEEDDFRQEGSVDSRRTSSFCNSRSFDADMLDGNHRRVSSVLKSESFQQVLDNVGVELSDTLEQKEEVCQNILITLLTIMWKGIEGSGEDVWKERCEVFTWIDELGESHVLIRPADEVKRRLLEMLLHNCASDIQCSVAQATPAQSENAIFLIRLVQSFVAGSDASKDRFSKRLLEDVMSLLEVLGVWDTETTTSWTEMVHKGISMLLAFSQLQDLDLVSLATVKLHSLVQTKLISSSAEASYILGILNQMIVKSIENNSDNYSYLMPVLRALIDKGEELLTTKTHLPNLPQTSMSPTFFDDFKTFVFSEEWDNFMSNIVGPQMSHFMESNFQEGEVSMVTFWSDCHESMMMNHHRYNRKIGESRLRFKSQIEEVYQKKVDQENKRFMNVMTQQKNQQQFALRQWRAVKRFFTSERGAWNDNKQEVTEVTHWKLSNQENFARMKVRMTQNFMFDDHISASQLRDNIGTVYLNNLLKLEELKGVKEALVSKENIADDALGDEEWIAISSSSTGIEEYTGKEKLVMSADCELITLVSQIKGRLEVTTTHVYFFDCSFPRDDLGEDYKWSLSRLREIHFRRYNLRRSALEFFFIDQTNYFINFPEKGLRNKIFSRILSLRPKNLSYRGQRSPADLLKASGLMQKWVNREISNFEYLMQLNTIAGRTYNDLSQYPVFPWILTDYTSKSLNLNNPEVFRDLSKPVGVMNPFKVEEVREKFDTFEDPSGVIEKFHYGTHYSNAANVMHYMIRMEPFTTLHIQLQSDKFDVADRQFFSIPGTFQSLMENPNDVKELIPEFFYLPEFLVNSNRFDLGQLQITKERVDDVSLPAWASTPDEFIYKHRQALESEHVSMNLHHWIDLIFGFKQKGPAAVEALNVFYYVTYEGAVDLDAIQNPKERLSVEGMINNFGQTPSQLMKEPHPKRLSFDESVSRMSKSGKPMSVFQFLKDLKPFFVEVSNDMDPLVFVNVPKSQSRSILQQGMPDSLVTLTQDGIIGVHGWLPFDKSIANFYTFDKDATMLNAKTKKRVSGPFCPGLQVSSKLFLVSHDAKLLFSGGYWDNSLQVHNLVRPKLVNHIVRHLDIVTCLSLDNCGRHLATGSRDTTCLVWEIVQQAGVSTGLNPKPIQTLYGHDAEVTCVYISTEMDIVVSASKDGTVNIHSVLKGHYIMTLRTSCQSGWTLDIPRMVVSDIGQIILYSVERRLGCNPFSEQEKHSLHLYTVNGKHLFVEPLQHAIGDMCVSGDYLVYGNQVGMLAIMEIFGLRHLTTLELLLPIQCVTVTNGSSHILAGLKDGKLIIVGNKGKSTA